MEEKVVWSGSSSQWINFGAYLACFLVFAAAAAALFLLWPRLEPMGPVALGAAFAVVLAPLAYALYRWIVVRCLRYEITSERIRVTSGILSKRTTTLELYRVKDYTLEAPFLYRLFRLGHIRLQTSDRSNPEMLLRAIPGARRLADEIRLHVEKRRDLKRVREVDFDEVNDADLN
ncbi:MAG TPA: PH domain-containing protein [Candidatus Aminicenantes bacterium]|nr:PH domain-containing protein [Candidatus Aminicenantes bacterium]